MARHVCVLLVGFIVLGLITAACGGGGDEAVTEPPAEPPPSETQVGTEPSEPAAPPPAPESPQPGDAADRLNAEAAAGWQLTLIDEGVKPALALDPEGMPAVVYVHEDLSGYIRYASATDWTPETIVDGYFYGPIDLAFDPAGRPNVVYHDHQDQLFDVNKGDLTYAIREDSNWTISEVADDGHDGWDSTITIARDGTVRAAGIDPSQLDSTEGVEYYELGADGWSVTAIDSGPIAYSFNVSLAVAPDGLPALSFYNDRDGDLVFAKSNGSGWELETVVTEGDTGKFPSLAFDDAGRPHISFYEETNFSSGTIRYAVRDGDAWTIEDVDVLDRVALGDTGARRNSALVIAADGRQHVVFSDQSRLSYAVRTDGSWAVEDIVQQGDRALGQLVTFALDDEGTPHIAFFEVESTTPLAGHVAYLTTS